MPDPNRINYTLRSLYYTSKSSTVTLDKNCIMTTMSNSRLDRRYWSDTVYHSRPYFSEYSSPLGNNMTYYESASRDITDEVEEYSPPPSAYEFDQPPYEATTTSSPNAESFPADMICRVCSAPAHGYNFDQITCESCKAFFRRNALRDASHMKCRFNGSCTISMNNRRQCTYCRLKKCFAVNMRKDWIRTDEERELRRLRDLQKQQRKMNRFTPYEQPVIHFPIVMRKKKRLMPLNHQSQADRAILPMPQMEPFPFHPNLGDSDRILLSNIRNAYQYGANRANFNHISQYTSSSSLSQFLNDESVNHQSLIYFYKQVPEFKQFDVEDQILLIKCNMVDLIHLHHIILQNFREPPQMADHMSKWIGPDFHYQMSRTRSRFDCFMRHPLVLQISLIVFVFSVNLSAPRGSTQFFDYTNRRKLYESQNIYLDLLWRYLNHLFDEREAIRSMQVIVTQILRYQLLMNTMDDALQRNNAHQDIFNPLMQSIFGLT